MMEHLCPLGFGRARQFSDEHRKKVAQEICPDALIHTVEPIDSEDGVRNSENGKERAWLVASGQHVGQEIARGPSFSSPSGIRASFVDLVEMNVYDSIAKFHIETRRSMPVNDRSLASWLHDGIVQALLRYVFPIKQQVCVRTSLLLQEHCQQMPSSSLWYGKWNTLEYQSQSPRTSTKDAWKPSAPCF